jgi:hypothetical protein
MNNRVICVILFFVIIGNVFAKEPTIKETKIFTDSGSLNTKIKINTFDVGRSTDGDRSITKRHCSDSACSSSSGIEIPLMLGLGVVYADFEFDYSIGFASMKMKYPELGMNFNIEATIHSFVAKYLFNFSESRTRQFILWLGLSLDVKCLDIKVESAGLGGSSLEGTILMPLISAGIELFTNENESINFSFKVSLPCNRNENLRGNATVGLSKASIKYTEVQFSSGYSWYF